MADEDETDDFGIDDTKKSERKRQRERQRRSDIASAFEELSSLLSQIDPEESDPNANNKRRRRKPGEAAESDVDGSGMTRLDLISRTAEVLRKLQRENAELRQQLEMQQQRPSGEDKEVLVMVPTLSPADPEHVPSRASPYPPYYFPPPHQPMEYRPQPSAQDYYSSRGPPPPSHGFPHYQGHPQHVWNGHPPPILPPPPGAMMPQQQPPQPSGMQYTPPNHPPPHPHQMQNQYAPHPSSSHAHSFNSSLDPPANAERRRDSA